VELGFKNKNVSRVELLWAYIAYGRTVLTSHCEALLKYRRIYKNYLLVLCCILRNKYPIEAVLRRGDNIYLHNHSEAIMVTLMEAIGYGTYEFYDNRVTLSYIVPKTNNKTKIELYDGVENGDLVNIFLHKEYKFLPVEGNTVIDIGANIGDSCIYFALNGAKQVIALEPFPKNFEMAKKNIETNHLRDIIILHQAGCAAKTGYITIDPLYRSKGNSCLREFKEGIKVPLLTLREILSKYNIRPKEVVLKIDCEGCEYQTILSSDDNTLKYFSHIQIEYHNGYKNLKEKLEKSEFIVSVTRPLLEHSTTDLDKKMCITGYLYATQKQNSELK
jgi:FkbM family methyltransferase